MMRKRDLVHQWNATQSSRCAEPLFVLVDDTLVFDRFQPSCFCLCPSNAPPTALRTPPASTHHVTSSNQQEEQVTYRDAYSHPAVQACPARVSSAKSNSACTKWGEEVVVKLIKRNNIEAAVRMGKEEREIAVLKALKYPNIVHLYEVLEADKYIGIILDYASGGELFDHILAHRCLKQKYACTLFSQLISGVWYIRRRKIIHRDLKLKNLLLDRNHKLWFAMLPAPELVISEGALVGSAVDIRSCRVILYAMPAGYLPFDDDPANPDGDNNLLYRYIVNTALSFPDYVSEDARDFLGLVLQPDPVKRAGLPDIMKHRWLAPYRYLLDKSA
ncbi:hypothetical protein EWM64_g9842, partial [Hericium alpestre]